MYELVKRLVCTEFVSEQIEELSTIYTAGVLAISRDNSV